MVNDPIARFWRWFGEAQRAGIPLREAMALATADRRGRPSVRFVLLKQADRRGFVFYGSAKSRKGSELRQNPRASLVFYWNQLGKQVRIEGSVEPVSKEEADAYWATRPRESRLAALASRQSAPLLQKSQLVSRFQKLHRQFRGKQIPRPREWTGSRVIPDSIEFWIERKHRLNDRELFLRTRSGWKRQWLQP